MGHDDELTWSFTDKSGRPIHITLDELCFKVTAFHEGREIGYLDIDVKEDGKPYAYAADVLEQYRRAGIGLEMVRRAAEYHSQELVPPKRFDPHKENVMTTDGYALMRSGQKHGWVGAFPDDELPEDGCE